MAMDPQTAERLLIQRGFNRPVATALAGRGITPGRAEGMTTEELFNEYLSWEGIQGYTRSIMNALDNIRNMEAN